MNEAEVNYGILMKKIKVNQDAYIFIPIHLIEGIIIGESTFCDVLGKEYSIFIEEDIIESEMILDEEYCIGYVISETELLERSESKILENAKMEFFGYAKDDCLFAIYNDNIPQYEFVFVDLVAFFNEYAKVISNKDIAYEIEKRITNEETQNNTAINLVGSNIKDGDSVLIMTKGDINKIISMISSNDREGLINAFNRFKDQLDEEKEVLDSINPSIIEEEETNSDSIVEEKNTDNIDVKDFYEKAKKKIIGQDSAIQDIISAVKMDQYAETPSERNRCLIIGPTGTGKTEIVKCLGEYLDKPIVKVDTTQFTVPGYKGEDLSEVLYRLVSAAGGDIKKAEQGIVTFDEFDKKSGNSENIFKKDFLHTLLPFLDGTDYSITVNGTKTTFNTSKLTIFASGSFSEVRQNFTLDKKAIGFNAKAVTIDEDKNLDPEEILKSASLPEEIIGRFSVIVKLNPHTNESLKRILLESDISQLKAEKRKFKCIGVDLNWEDKYIEEVVNKAIKLNIGARSLKKIIETSIKELRWEILTNPNKYTTATLLEETVDNPKVYRLK